MTPTRLCACGAEFSPRVHNQRYCAAACPVRRARIRDTERRRKNEGELETGWIERVCACGKRYAAFVEPRRNKNGNVAWGQCFCSSDCQRFYEWDIVRNLQSVLGAGVSARRVAYGTAIARETRSVIGTGD